MGLTGLTTVYDNTACYCLAQHPSYSTTLIVVYSLPNITNIFGFLFSSVPVSSERLDSIRLTSLILWNLLLGSLRGRQPCGNGISRRFNTSKVLHCVWYPLTARDKLTLPWHIASSPLNDSPLANIPLVDVDSNDVLLRSADSDFFWITRMHICVNIVLTK